jgi:hypothetical protein
MKDTYVAGEPVKDLIRALVQSKRKTLPDGSVSLKLRLEPDVAAPLWRALMRVEAELLLEDADQLRPDNSDELRTEDQRRYDAFVELTRRLGETIPA